MSDLRDRFALADRLEAPALWNRVEDKARELSSSRPTLPVAAIDRRRIVAVVVAFAVFLGAAALLWQMLPRSGHRAALEPPPTVDPWAAFPSGLTELPPVPSGRYGSAVVWTGDQVVLWGGARNDGNTTFSDGFAFDPNTRTWTPLPPSPLEARYHPVSVWTGQEVIIWGGWRDGATQVSDGAAYDPIAQTWRPLAAAPIPFDRSVGAWTGTEMIVWNPEDASAAVYQPATDSWRRITDAPVSLERVMEPVWTGSMMVAAGLPTSGAHSLSDARALAYDPDTDSWQELSPPDLDGNAIKLVWTGSELIGIDLVHRVRSYEPGQGWSDLPPIPTDSGEFVPQAAVVGGQLFVDTYSGQAVMDLGTHSWKVLPSVRSPDTYVLPVAAGSALVLWQAEPRSSTPNHFSVWRPAP
jgi:Kelch motif